MDPSSLYVFQPPALSLQQSKLATYLNLNNSGGNPGGGGGAGGGSSSAIVGGGGGSSDLDLSSSTSPESRRKSDENEFVPSMYFSSSAAADLLAEAAAKADIFAAPPDKCIAAAASAAASSSSSSSAVQVHQENVGGTTYFFSRTNSESSVAASNNGSAAAAAAMQMAPPPHMMHPHLLASASKSSLLSAREKVGAGGSSFQLAESIRSEIMLKNQITYAPQSDDVDFQLPAAVEQYAELVPLEDGGEREEGVVAASTYRVTHRESGRPFVMRRLHDFNFAFTKLPLVIDKWKKLSHPNLVRLREVFSTKVFGDQSLVFIYDFHASSVTLYERHMLVNRAGMESIDPFNSDPDTPRPFSHQKNAILRAAHAANFMPENTIWNIIVQITAGLRAVHNAGLSCWYLDPTKIIVSGASTVRIAWGGVNEIVKVARCGSTGLPTSVDEAQQEDLLALGRVVVALACQSAAPLEPRLCPLYAQTVARDCSADLKNLVLYLLSSASASASSSSKKSLVDLMPMIGARFYSFTERLQRRVDALEDQLALELDNGRLYRLLVALDTVVERPELNMDHSWAETGDRYILKLFRDYVFHSVTPDGKPWLDNAHIVYCLNQLDSATNQRIQLVSRNGQSVLIVTYFELNQCLGRAFNEVIEAS